MSLPVVVVGAGPIGLITALGLRHHGIDVIVLEEDDRLSLDTKAGTVLTRTLEVLDRYGAAEAVLSAGLRIDEIGEIDRASGQRVPGVLTGLLADDTRFPFVLNIPQHTLEAVLERRLAELAPGALRLSHRVEKANDLGDRVELTVQNPHGQQAIEAAYVLACDGGRSPIRTALGIEARGFTLEQRYMLVDLRVDLDVANPRDYPYLAYFSDPDEWMILVRQPHCWRFLFPLGPDAEQPSDDELRAKALHFIGDITEVELLGTNIYTVHHRVASEWSRGRVHLMGDAAHLITPMWALGLNTGVLDASNLPWRLAWVLRGWADPALLAGYGHEQSSIAIEGSGRMAEDARQAMGGNRNAGEDADSGRGLALTRTLLGVRLDVDRTGEWAIVHDGHQHPLRPGDRVPDLPLQTSDGSRAHLHELVADSFVALHFGDARRRPSLPDDEPGLRHLLVSRWDAPHDSGLRERSAFDPGDRVRDRLGVRPDTVVLLRPDAHVAGVVSRSEDGTAITDHYREIVRPKETHS